MNQLAYPHTVRDIVMEYHTKHGALDDTLAAAELAIDTLNANCEVGTGRYEPVASPLRIHRQGVERILLSSAWRAIYQTLNLDSVFSAADKKKFDQSLSDPAPLTLENLQATFGQYWENPRYYILKGLAEVFCTLDKFYKSHSNFGFGVKGLPKRAILGNFAGYSSWGFDRMNDMCAAMEQVKPGLWLGEHVPEPERQPWRDIIRAHSCVWGQSKPFTLHQFGLEIRTFANGNAHVHFNKRALGLINDCLHEFYGSVIPDDFEKPDKKQAGTEVSKDLAFYPTPAAVIEEVLADLYIHDSAKILEPSCGTGAILDALRKRGHDDLLGVEYHPGRAQTCREKGYAVWTGNFLEYATGPTFDVVIMNPPFCSKHWAKHVHKAMECLRPGGTLVAILPATAEGSDLLPKGGAWRDLPVGSFRESGTNVGTGYWKWRKK
ncbi:class I SAM-dependent methyltransferase [Halopseudomonas xiamenensis]|uniref:class I SAM-dependent methyltransferase n=1 Tax=Halopseudomonas xiamenensis TaxID=157792 RepID=UPI0016237721|nr:class I SAM-dependent methyltransferase [Halopseudomonas xiamenensis]